MQNISTRKILHHAGVILVLEVNCISNLRPSCTLELATLRRESLQNICEGVATTTLQKYDAFEVILSQMFSG